MPASAKSLEHLIDKAKTLGPIRVTVAEYQWRILHRRDGLSLRGNMPRRKQRTGCAGMRPTAAKPSNRRLAIPDLLCPRRVAPGAVPCKSRPRHEIGQWREDAARLDQTIRSGAVGQRMVSGRWIKPATQTHELADKMTLSRLWVCLQ